VGVNGASEIAAVVVTLAFLGFLKWAAGKFNDGVVEQMKQINEYLKKRNGSLEKNDVEIIKSLRVIQETQDELITKAMRINDE